MKIKHKLLSILLAIFLIVPCFAFVGCGDKPDDPHTHAWSADWSKDSTYHWHSCSGCSEKKDKNTHNGDPCSVCGYTATSGDGDGLEVVSSVRDLEVITFDTGSEGLFTLVRLPDGKNMLIDSGDERFDTYMMVENTLLYAEGLSTIDYFVLTNTSCIRTGQAAYIMRNFEVYNLFTPRTINNSAPSCYTSAVAQASSSCNVVEVAESNCDISNSFRVSGSNNVYTYNIDFMLPVATADCTNEIDASIVISIEYQGKTILITSDNSQNNIKGYIDNYDGEKDVDVLITSFEASDPYAITNSPSFAGKDFFESISLEAGDYAIITPISLPDRVNVLDTALRDLLGRENALMLTEGNNLYTAYVKINSSGQITVTAE